MDSDLKEISTLLLTVFKEVKKALPVVFPQTYISKAMLDSGIRQGIFLYSIGRSDGPIELGNPIPLMGSPIFVNMWMEDMDYLSGNISCFSYNIDISHVNWDLDYTVEGLTNFISVRRNFIAPPGVERPG